MINFGIPTSEINCVSAFTTALEVIDYWLGVRGRIFGTYRYLQPDLKRGKDRVHNEMFKQFAYSRNRLQWSRLNAMFQLSS